MMQQIMGGGRDAGSSSDDVRIQMLTPRSAQALVQRAQTIDIEDRPSVEVGPSEVPKVEVGPSQVEVGPSSKSLGKQSVPSKVDVGPASKSLGKQSVESCTKAILDGLVDRSAATRCAAKAKGKTKAAAKKEAKAKGKAKAVATKVEKVAKPGDLSIKGKMKTKKLGCSKCRYLKNGCARCRARLGKS